MQLVKLDTGFNIEVDFGIAPFHKRFFALFIDWVILYGYLILGQMALQAMFGPEWTEGRWPYMLFILPFIFYHLLCEWSFNGRSVGKMLMRIRVIAADGGHPTISQYIIRWLFRMIDMPVWILFSIRVHAYPWWTAVFLFGGLLAILVTKHAQRLGDLAAGTLLIDTRTLTSWEDTVFTELEDNYKPRFPKVMQLNDKEINALKSIISTVKKKGNYDLSMRIGERIKAKLDIQSDQDSLDFLETLLKDYNYYSTN